LVFKYEITPTSAIKKMHDPKVNSKFDVCIVAPLMSFCRTVFTAL
jgi:hypothetical protein